jgi:hypothetical protein
VNTATARKPRCTICRKDIEPKQTGRPRRFCSSACRQAAYRKRAKRSVHFRSDSDEPAAGQALPGGLSTRKVPLKGF